MKATGQFALLCGIAAVLWPRSAFADDDRQRGRAEARAFYYSDDHALDVWTWVVGALQPITSSLFVRARAWVDRVDAGNPSKSATRIAGPVNTGHDPSHVGNEGGPTTATPQPDTVSSASTAIASGAKTGHYRIEGLAGVGIRLGENATPGSVELQARASHETDYDSLSSTLIGAVELAERNFGLAGFVGFAHDAIDPLPRPAGQQDSWPASHSRLYAGASATQLLGSRMLAFASAAITAQYGQLANPYRPAVVRTSLFPELVPRTRLRHTASLGLALYLGWNTALHLRQGLYADSWAVVAWIPEAFLQKSFAQRWLLTLGYRYYTQSAASFHNPRFSDIATLLVSDARLGNLRNHTLRVDLAWTALTDNADRSLDLQAGYRLSAFDYADTNELLLAHVVNVGIAARY